MWDQREVELERQLDHYEKHQSEVLGSAEKVFVKGLMMIKSLSFKDVHEN